MILLGIVSGGFVLLLILAAILLPLFALVSILRNEFTGSNKLIWVIVVIFFPILGALLYFVIGTSQINRN